MAEKTTRSTTAKKKSTTAKKAAARPVAKNTPAPRREPRRTVAKKETPVSALELAPAPSVRRRPIFQAGTWISIFMLAALVGLAFYLNREKEKTATEATPTLETAYIFTEADGVVSSIEIKPAEGETVKIARDAENVWTVVLPIEAEANQGLAEAAAAQLTALPISTQIEDGTPDIFGLDEPAYVITIGLMDGKERKLDVGDTTPTNSGYYVRVDKDKMLVTDLNGIDALLNLASFPPYLNTPTPIALPPTETPIPTAEAAVTPTP